MKIIGKRFWTWMGVWMIGLFVRGEVAGAREDRPDQQETTTPAPQHKSHKVPTPLYSKHKASTDAITVKQTDKIHRIRAATDAGSKDPAKRTFKTHKSPLRKKP